MAITTIPNDLRTSKRDAAFWRRVDVRGTNECWLWKDDKQLTQSGYGTAFYGTIRTTAHRIAYMLVKGFIPDGMDILHSCDVRRCCNTAHHFPGTAQDNTDDMIAKGRDNFVGAPVGERNGNAKLSDTIIPQIFERSAMGMSQRQIGAQFGISKSEVGNILRGENRAAQAPIKLSMPATRESGYYWVKRAGYSVWEIAEWLRYEEEPEDEPDDQKGSWRVIVYDPSEGVYARGEEEMVSVGGQILRRPQDAAQ